MVSHNEVHLPGQSFFVVHFLLVFLVRWLVFWVFFFWVVFFCFVLFWLLFSKESIFQADMLPIFPFPLLGNFKIQSNNSKRDDRSRRRENTQA